MRGGSDPMTPGCRLCLTGWLTFGGEAALAGTARARVWGGVTAMPLPCVLGFLCLNLPVLPLSAGVLLLLLLLAYTVVAPG